MIQDTIKLGLVGLNFGAHWHKRDVEEGEGRKYVKVVVACDMDEDKAKAFATAHNCRYTLSINQLLSDPEVEAVVLMTPPNGRAELVRQCIQAGKPVLTTKPFELDAQATLEVLQEAKERRVAVHLNSPSPVLPDDLVKIFAWQKEYNLGQPIAARWENYARYYEEANNSWYDSSELCPFAPIYRIGIYGINDLISIFGEVESIQGTATRLFTGRPTPDNAEVSLKFKNGGIASVFASFCIGDGFPYQAALTLHFERGTVTRRFVSPGKIVRDAIFSSVHLTLNCIYENSFHAEDFSCSLDRRSGAYLWKEFYEAVRSGKPLPDEIDPETVASGIRVVEMMKKL